MSRITTPFGATSTAAEVLGDTDLTGRRALVTGGASGIGVETIRALAGAGAEVTIAVRDTAAGERVADDVIATTGNKHVQVVPLELTDHASVDAVVRGWEGPLHMLVNNAGVMATPLTRTAEGWELQFATNHLGHFRLTTGLHDALAAAGGARVVSVSSSAHLESPVVFDDIMFQNREYEPKSAYGQSKTANILFAVEADQRWADDGIRVNAVHPGSISTNLQRHVDAEVIAAWRAAAGVSTGTSKTPEQGAATSVLLAASPLIDGVGGRYFQDCAEAEPYVPGVNRGVAGYALDPEAARRLWRETLRLLAR